eukprot:gene8446-9935_t
MLKQGHSHAATDDEIRRAPKMVESGLYGRYGCDANMELFNSTLMAMQAIDDTPNFILFTGDSAGHYLPRQDWEESTTTFTKLLAATYPSSLVIPTIGNNDVFPDYNVSCADSNLEYLADMWSNWIPRSSVTPFYFNNPSFKVYTYEQTTFNILNISTYSTDLFDANYQGSAEWDLEYSFNDYHIDGQYIDGTTLSDLTVTMQTDSSLFSLFDNHRTSMYLPDDITTICLLRSSTTDQYNDCLSSSSTYAEIRALRKSKRHKKT